MIFSVFYLVVRCLLGSLMVLVRWEASKDAEFLVLLHQNAVLRRQISRVRYQPADRLWLAALSRLILWGSIIGFSGRCLGFRRVVWLSGGDPVLAGQAA